MNGPWNQPWRVQKNPEGPGVYADDLWIADVLPGYADRIVADHNAALAAHSTAPDDVTAAGRYCGTEAPGVAGLVCVLGPGHTGLCYSKERYGWIPLAAAPTAAADPRDQERDQLWQDLRWAAIRLGIAADRMRACHEETHNHGLLEEIEMFEREAIEALLSVAPPDGYDDSTTFLRGRLADAALAVQQAPAETVES